MKARTPAKKTAPAALKGARPLRVVSREVGNVHHERSRGRFTSLGYQSTETLIRDGKVAPSGSGDLFLEWSRPQLVAQARDFDRNNALFGGLIDKAASYLVGDGFQLQASTKDAEYNELVEQMWREFWSGPDARPEISGQHSGFDVEDMLAREMLSVGDVGVVLTDQGKVQIVESEQIAGKSRSTTSGVERQNGRITGYWVAPWGPGGQVQAADARKISTSAFLYCGRPRRPSSVRAVPPLQAAFPMFHRIADVCDSEAMAFMLQSRLAISVNRANAVDALNTLGKTEKTGDTKGKASVKVLDFDYGMVIAGEVGDEIKGIERSLPGQNFGEAITTFARLLGQPVGIPLEIIMLDWSHSNYSQARAVLLQAYRSFVRYQRTLAERVLTPVFRWAVDAAIAEGRLPRMPEGFDPYQHDWVYPTWPWIDLLHEAQAYALKLDRSLCTHSQALKSLGNDPESFIDATEAEIRKAIAIVSKIKADTQVDVPWQLFCGREMSVNPATGFDADADRANAGGNGGTNGKNKKPAPAPARKEQDA